MVWSENEADYTGNALILKQIEDAKIEGISCSFDAGGSNCDYGSVGLRADAGGLVRAGDDVGYCNVLMVVFRIAKATNCVPYISESNILN